jgi:hypothetical protein
MKKIIVSAFALLISLSGFAQANTWLLMGNAGYSNNSSNNNLPSTATSNSITWSVSPGIGYQFTDNLAVGIQGMYSATTNNNTSSYLFYYPTNYVGNMYYSSMPKSLYNWGLGAFARYNHQFNATFFFYGQLNMTYVAGEQTYGNAVYNPTTLAYSDAKTTSNGIQIGLIPGFGAHIYKGIALTFDMGGVNYNTLSQVLNGQHYNESHVNVTFAQQFTLGITDNFKIKHRTHSHIEPGADLRRHSKEADDDDDDAPPAKKK